MNNDAIKEAEARLEALLAEAKAAGLELSKKPAISHVPSKTHPFYSDSYKALVIPFAWTGRRLAGYFGVPWKLNEIPGTPEELSTNPMDISG